MKKLTVWLMAVAVIGLSVSVMAEEGKPEGKGEAKGKGKCGCKGKAPSAECVKKYDKDGDNKLSDTEMEACKADMKAQKDAILAKYDTDKNGELSDTEKTDECKKEMEALIKICGKEGKGCGKEKKEGGCKGCGEKKAEGDKPAESGDKESEKKAEEQK
jgi:hypothetical protein